MSTVFCYIDSRDRCSGSASDFQVQLMEPVQLFTESKLRVDQIRLVNSFLTVDVNNQNVYLLEGSSVRVATLPLGWYNAINLSSVIASSLSGGGHTYNTSYNQSTNALTISCSSAFSILTDAQLQYLSNWPGPSGTSQAVPMSFNDILQNTTAANPNTSFHIAFVNVSPYDYLFLRSRRLASDHCMSARGEHDVLARIDVDSAFGGLLTGGTPLQEALLVGSGTLRNIDFQLTDRLGNVVPLNEGSLTFQLTFFN
jgi:hypothetical protein